MSINASLTFSVFFALALSIDAFVAALSYSASGIKISVTSTAVISLVCTVLLCLSLACGQMLKTVLPSGITLWISGIILIFLGMAKLFESSLKAALRRYRGRRKKLYFTLTGFDIVLSVYANPKDADIDNNRILSHTEAVLLAMALSFDGAFAGIGAALAGVPWHTLAFATLCITFCAVCLGNIVGKTAHRLQQIDFSWLCGVALLIIGVLRVRS